MIHVCYGLYDRDGHYSKFVGTSVVSIFENTSERVTVHILHDNTLTIDNRDKFVYLAGQYGQRIKFYNVERLADKQLELIKNDMPDEVKAKFTIGSMYRLLAPIIIPDWIDKIIYLDADIIVNLDIKEMWRVDVSSRPMAVVSEKLIHAAIYSQPQKYLIDNGIVKAEDYFNSGVLLINLDYLRAHADIINEGYRFVCEHPECDAFDQDILNYCFAADSVKLDLKFDTFVIVERMTNESPAIKRAVYHYTSDTIKLNPNDALNRLYFEYFVKTPWFNVDIVWNIMQTFENSNRNHQSALLNMANALGKRQRIFLASKNNFGLIKNLFEITNDEIIIDAADDNAIERLSSLMINEGGWKGNTKYCLHSSIIIWGSKIFWSNGILLRALILLMLSIVARCDSVCRPKLISSSAQCESWEEVRS